MIQDTHQDFTNHCQHGHSTTTSWAIESCGDGIRLSLVHSHDEPGLVTLSLLGQCRDDFPCGYCVVDDPSLPDHIDLSERQALKMYLGLWPTEIVSRWCRDLLDMDHLINGHNSSVTSCALRHDATGLLAERCTCGDNILLYATGQTQCDLPCQVCDIDCSLIEEQPDDHARVLLGRMPMQTLESLCHQAILLLEVNDVNDSIPS